MRDREGRVIASLCVADNKVRAWTRRDLLTLEGIARLLMRELENRAIKADLEASERLARQILTHQFQFSGLLTPEGRIVEVSGSALRNAGVTREQLGGQVFLDTIWFRDLPEVQAQWRQQIAEAVRTGTSSEVEARYDKPDGTQGWAINRVSALRDGTGRIEHLLVEGIDISERKRSEQALEQRNRQLDILARSAQALLLAGGKEDEALHSIFKAIADLLGVEAFYHYRPAPEPKVMALAMAGGVGEKERRLFGTMRYGELLCGRVAETRKRLVVEDLQHSTAPGSDVLRREGATSYAGFPLVAGGRLIGTVAFISGRRTSFSDDEIQTVQTVCDHVATALERSRLQRELEASERRLAVEVEDLRRLHELSFELAELSDVRTVLQSTLRAAAALMGVQSGGVQVRENSGSLSLISLIGFDEAVAARFWSFDEAVVTTCGTALAEKQRVIVTDISRDVRYVKLAEAVRPHRIGGAVSTPLLDSAGEVSAMFTLFWPAPHEPTERELRLLDLCAGIAARHLERSAAAEAVRIREERFQTAEQAASGLVYEWDVRANRLWRSDGITRVAGWLPHEIAPTQEAWIDLWHPEDLRRFKVQLPDKFIGADGSYSAEYRIRHKDGHWVWVWDRGRAERDADGRLLRLVGATIDISARKQSEEQILLLMREVNHRAKNMLGLVMSIARQTAATDPADFVARFSERIQALSANQDLLVNNAWTGVGIEELTRAQLATFKDVIGTRITIEGPPLRFTPAAAQALGLALHELATNAAKYGALSDAAGCVDIGWRLDGDSFVFSWAERNGPAVTPPTRKGFGTTVINSLARMSVYGEVENDYAPSGFRWQLNCPAEKALEATSRGGGGEGSVKRSQVNAGQ